ncbi:hypothetical protein N665_0070s0022, partial [Sinapis alba]
YISTCESAWRILAFPTHYRSRPVEKLTFHLEGEQPVIYKEGDSAKTVRDRVQSTKTMFLAWFDCCITYPEARELTYAELPTRFVYDGKQKIWNPRKKDLLLGDWRMYLRLLGNFIFLRVLLNKVRGPTCYADIRTVNGIVHPSYEDACYERGLLDNDKEYIEGLILTEEEILNAVIRSRGKIVLNVASSGIASLLLPGGRTAHSRFGIPINPDEFLTCKIQPGSNQLELIAIASLIMWNKTLMMSKHCFEALDRTMAHIMKSPEGIPFRGKVVVFEGDFRQILYVILRENRADIVMATLNSSFLWKHCKLLELTKNMRLMAETDLHEAQEIKIFSKWILDLGDGKINEPNNVEVINDYMLDRLKDEERIYLRSDSVDPSDLKSKDDYVFSPEFLNSIKVAGLPNHALRLRIGTPVMILRNVDHTEGLCNGTRLQITQLANHIIGEKFITGTRVGEKVWIHRLLIEPSDASLSFKMRRRQFPLKVAFAMTINKSQDNVGLYLPKPVFSHGQLYVAVSWVKSRKGLKILIIDKERRHQESTMNEI